MPSFDNTNQTRKKTSSEKLKNRNCSETCGAKGLFELKRDNSFSDASFTRYSATVDLRE